MSFLRRFTPPICVIIAVGLLLLGHVLRTISDSGLIQWRYGLEYWVANGIHLGVAVLVVVAILNCRKPLGPGV